MKSANHGAYISQNSWGYIDLITSVGADYKGISLGYSFWDLRDLRLPDLLLPDPEVFFLEEKLVVLILLGLEDDFPAAPDDFPEDLQEALPEVLSEVFPAGVSGAGFANGMSASTSS